MGECSRSHGDQAGRWLDELDGRRGPERTGGCLDMEEIGEIQRGEVINGFESEEKDFVGDTDFDGEPVELLQDRCYMTDGGGSSNYTCGRVLDQLKFMDGFVR